MPVYGLLLLILIVDYFVYSRKVRQFCERTIMLDADNEWLKQINNSSDIILITEVIQDKIDQIKFANSMAAKIFKDEFLVYEKATNLRDCTLLD